MLVTYLAGLKNLQRLAPAMARSFAKKKDKEAGDTMDLNTFMEMRKQEEKKEEQLSKLSPYLSRRKTG